MAAKCKYESCTRNVFSHEYCQVHQSLRVDQKWLARLEKKKQNKHVAIKIAKRIKPQSDKEKQRMEKYMIIRNEFMSRPENKMCAVFPELEATENHHIAGRLGDMLFDTDFFLAVSRPGHLWLHDHVEKARKLGFIKSRLS